MRNVNLHTSTQINSLTNEEMMEILRHLENDYYTATEGKNLKDKIINYLLSLGTAFNNENQYTDLLNSLPEDVKKQLLNPLLFNNFISNKIKITPEVRDDWKVDYRLQDVCSGYVTLTSNGMVASNGTINQIKVQRVPVTHFLNLMKDGILNERGHNNILEIRGQLLIGKFIVNKDRKLYSEAFYNFWKKIHFPERNVNEENIVVSWKVNKDNLKEGNYYRIPNLNNQFIVEKYLGQKYVFSYKVLDGELVPKIQKKRFSIQTYVTPYNLNQNISEKVYGNVKNLAPYKKLQYFEEIQNLPFIDQIQGEDINKKIEFANMHNNDFIGVIDKIPLDYKKNPGFKIVRSKPGELCNVILYNDKYFLGNNWVLPEDITDTFRYSYNIYPKYALIQDRLKVGRISIVDLRSSEGQNKYSSISGNKLNFNNNLDNCYRLVPNTLISRNNFLNFEDGFQL